MTVDPRDRARRGLATAGALLGGFLVAVGLVGIALWATVGLASGTPARMLRAILVIVVAVGGGGTLLWTCWRWRSRLPAEEAPSPSALDGLLEHAGAKIEFLVLFLGAALLFMASVGLLSSSPLWGNLRPLHMDRGECAIMAALGFPVMLAVVHVAAIRDHRSRGIPNERPPTWLESARWLLAWAALFTVGMAMCLSAWQIHARFSGGNDAAFAPLAWQVSCLVAGPILLRGLFLWRKPAPRP